MRVTWSLPPDFVAQVKALVPQARAEDFQRLSIMVGGDVVIRDDGTPHPAFVAWVRDILERDAGEAMALPPAPVKPSPAGASVGVMA